MTYIDADTAIVNRALQVIGTRTTVSTAEMNALSTNEAIQANLIFTAYRDQLLRMAPWDCAMKVANCIYITSVPGTPENTSDATNNWQPGQPAPPWAYEYWYPNDCLRVCYIIPAQQTGFADGVPITTAITGGAPAFWQGMPVKFKVATDQFRAASGSVTIVDGGSGYAVGDTVIFGVDTLNQNFNAGEVPTGIIYATVATLSGSAIATVTLTAFGGTQVSQNAMLFGVPTYNLAAVLTSGLGTGAEISIAAVGATQFSARVILTNQEFANVAYVKQVTDVNLMDPLFQEAWVKVLGAGLQYALRDDKALANQLIGQVNSIIVEARKADGNEGLTVNDVTPDFIRIRGITSSEYYTGPYSQFDWGSNWPVY